ncbi:MAG TPA: hypothetical protein PKX15_02925 [Bacteroidales bacterium]|nr:hypothetical protein [Bacteroidales bacterium]
MNNFSQDIYEFKKNGTYTYKFDNSGNAIFNEKSSKFSHVYLSIPLSNPVMDENKINKFYNVEFEEFIPVTSSIKEESIAMSVFTQQMEILKEENESLKTKLDSAILASESNRSVADQMAIKQTILGLRIALGEGRVESDFSEDFPYTPLKHNEYTR